MRAVNAAAVVKTVVAIVHDPVEHLVLEVLEEVVAAEGEAAAEAEVEVEAAGEVVDFRVHCTDHF